MGIFFEVILLFVFVSAIAWWGKIREAASRRLLGSERVSHAPGASDLQNCVHSLSLELAPQFPGSGDYRYK